jgi:hypothetical protein
MCLSRLARSFSRFRFRAEQNIPMIKPVADARASSAPLIRLIATYPHDPGTPLAPRPSSLVLIISTSRPSRPQTISSIVREGPGLLGNVYATIFCTRSGDHVRSQRPRSPTVAASPCARGPVNRTHGMPFFIHEL